MKTSVAMLSRRAARSSAMRASVRRAPARTVIGNGLPTEAAASSARRYEALRKKGRDALAAEDWDGVVESLREYAGPTQAHLPKKDRAKGKLRRVLTGLSDEKLSAVHARAQAALRQDLESVKQVAAGLDGAAAEAMREQQQEMEALLAKYEAAAAKGMSDLEARAISKELGEVAKRLEKQLQGVSGAAEADLADPDDQGHFGRESEVRDRSTTTKFFTDYRGTDAGLPVYGAGVRTRDRGYPGPPVGSDLGLIMEDPKAMDPRVNPDLPYTMDDSEGMVVLHFHKGPYAGQELVLASVSPTIEWVVPSPPPLHLFEESPIVKEHPDEWSEIEHSHN